jgi:predicted lipoprotein
MKKWVLFSAISTVVIATFFVVGCGKNKNNNGNGSSNFDRGAMFTNYADNYIIPAYADVIVKLNTMKTEVNKFATTPDTTNLKLARSAWKQAYITWQGADMLEFGPEASVGLRNFVNIYPVSVTKVNTNITSGSYDLEQFGSKDAQGFPAVDYLLNGLATNDTAIISFYTAETNAANRKQYLIAITDKMIAKVTATLDAWHTYRNSFVTNTSTDAGGSLSIMTNAYIQYFERYLRAGKIGLPVGAMTGVAAPELTEAYYMPSLAKELAIAALNGVSNFYEGMAYGNNASNGIGYKEYLATVGTVDGTGRPMADVISIEFADAKTAMTDMPSPIATAVTTNRQDILKVYQALQQLVPLLKVDMVSAFGISITYVDNDGD